MKCLNPLKENVPYASIFFYLKGHTVVFTAADCFQINLTLKSFETSSAFSNKILILIIYFKQLMFLK